MEIARLKEMLKVVGPFVVISYTKLVPHFVKCFQQHQARLVKAEWSDEHKNDEPDIFPLDLTSLETWSTSENSVRAKFSIQNEQVHVWVSVLDGGGLFINREEMFVAEFYLPDDSLASIESDIEAEFEEYLEIEYEKQIEKNKLEWMENLKNRLLSK